MAFKLEVIRGATTYTVHDLTDSNVPFKLDSAEGMGGASVRNIEESGPYQDGSTHLAERLEPRTMTLRFNVIGASAATLDGYRDTLMAIFKPIPGVPITLKVTRDDGAIRQIDTRRAGALDIPLVKENKPGNLHRAVVQLRAADPAYYDPDEEEVDFTAPTGDWWLAHATIPAPNVLTHVESPTQGQLWNNAGSVVAGSPFTIVFRSGSVTPDAVGGGFSAFETDHTATGDNMFFPAFAGFPYSATIGGAFQVNDNIMGAGTQDYFLVVNGGTMDVYRGTVLVGSDTGVHYVLPGTANGTSRWRSEVNNDPSTYWSSPLPAAAVYNIALSQSQRTNLSDHMNQAGVVGGSAHSGTIVYAGDLDSYPVITINGPITDPVITNLATGDVLDFTGGTVGTADIWTIDTRYGRKSAMNTAGSSVQGYLSDDSDLATFRIVPAPIATGGTNIFTVDSSAAGTASAVTVNYYNRYLSF